MKCKPDPRKVFVKAHRSPFATLQITVLTSTNYKKSSKYCPSAFTSRAARLLTDCSTRSKIPCVLRINLHAPSILCCSAAAALHTVL